MHNYSHYQKYLVTSLISVSLILIVLIGLNAFVSPHVRNVQILSGDRSDDVSVVRPSLSFNFSSPMDRNSVAENITIDPAADYDVSWSGNRMQLRFKSNLQLDTKYIVRLTSAAKDIFGTNLGGNFEYQFQTSPAKFTYMERNSRNFIPDKILEYDIVKRQSRLIFSGQNIENYARNRKYMAITQFDNTKVSQLNVLDLNSNALTSIQLPGIKDFRVDKIIFSPRYDNFVVVAGEVAVTNGIAVPQGGNSIYLYDIPTGNVRKYQPQNVLDILFAPDGGSVMFRGDDGVYYLLDLQSEEVIDLGQHFASGGFSSNVDRIVFVDYDPYTYLSDYPNINIYDTNRKIESLTKGENFVIDPIFTPNGEGLVYSEKYDDLDGAKGYFSVKVMNLQGKVQREIKLTPYSLELPKPSADNRYIVIEKYAAADLVDYNQMRNFVFQSKPYTGMLVVYDLVENKFLDINLNGVNATWY